MIALAAFVAGVIGGNIGDEPSPAAGGSATVTSIVERKVFTADCMAFEGNAEKLACDEAQELIKQDAVDKAAAATTTAPPTTAPKPKATKPPAPSFGDGQYAVPSEMKPGTYVTSGGEGCYWARLKGFGGHDIIANDLPEGRARVTISPTDRGFETQGCGDWRKVG